MSATPPRDVFAAPGSAGTAMAPVPGSVQPPPTESSGLAIAALALGTVAALLCWVPLVDILSVACAFAGLGVGIPAIVRAPHGRRAGTAMAIAGIVLSAVALVVCVVVTAYAVTAALQLIDQLNQEITGS